MAAWLTGFGAVLRLNGLHLDELGSFGREEFQRLRHGGPTEAAWIGRVTGEADPASEAVLVLDRAERLSRYAEKGFPSLYILRPTGLTWSMHRYDRVTGMPISETLVLPDSPHKTYVWQEGGRIRFGREDAPEYVAEALARTFRSGGFKANWTDLPQRPPSPVE